MRLHSKPFNDLPSHWNLTRFPWLATCSWRVISRHHFRVCLAPVKHNMPYASPFLFLLHGTLPSDMSPGNEKEALPDVTMALVTMLVIGLQVTTALFTNRSKVNAVTSNHKTRAETLLPLPVDSWKMHVLNVKTDVQAQHVDFFEQPQNKQRNQGTTFLQNHLTLKLFPWGRSRSLDSWWRTLCNADTPVCVQLPRHLELFAQGLILWKANYQVTKGHLT